MNGALREFVRGVLAEASAKPRGFVQNIERLTLANRDFRRVLYTTHHLQLVVMEIPAGEHIGAETHPVDQFFRVESGVGIVFLEDEEHDVRDGDAIIVPAGAHHDIVNAGDAPLKLYTLYAPPHHRDSTVHRTRQDAENDDERFNGDTSP
jgi:mannose-6-phosphate isomerase-like protein (cupin superfamily)